MHREREDWRGTLPTPERRANAHAGSYAGVGPANYQVPDARVFQLVCEALADHARIDASHIHVGVAGGTITLDGDVPDAHQVALAGDCTSQVRGVRAVHNRLRATARHSQ